MIISSPPSASCCVSSPKSGTAMSPIALKWWVFHLTRWLTTCAESKISANRALRHTSDFFRAPPASSPSAG